MRGLELGTWDAVQSGLPSADRHILVQSDDDTVVVYQAFDAEISAHAVAHGAFGGHAWRQDRVSAIRLSLTDVLHRSNWGQDVGEERILAIRIKRAGFDSLLRQAIHREFQEGLYDTKRSWQLATRYSQVSIEWGPDRDLNGAALGRQTARFGMRHKALQNFATTWIDEVIDLTGWLKGVRNRRDLQVPIVAIYPVGDEGLVDRLTYRGT